MRAARSAAAGAALTVLLLAACGDGEPKLMNLRSTGAGPDEFGILPTRPLQMPDSLRELPAPTPGGSNLVDPTPEADAIAALGGNPNRQGGIPAADASVVRQATRFGSESGIRETLATADYDWRRRHNGRLLDRLFSKSVYLGAYSNMTLDQQAELARWRATGVRNPSAPPKTEAK